MDNGISIIYIDGSNLFRHGKKDQCPQQDSRKFSSRCAQTRQRSSAVQTVLFQPEIAGTSENSDIFNLDWQSLKILPPGPREIRLLEELLQFKAWQKHLSTMVDNNSPIVKRWFLQLIKQSKLRLSAYEKEDLEDDIDMRLNLAKEENSQKWRWELRRIDNLQRSLCRRRDADLIQKINRLRLKFNRQLQNRYSRVSAAKLLESKANHLSVREGCLLHVQDPLKLCRRVTSRTYTILDDIQSQLRSAPTDIDVTCNLLKININNNSCRPSTPTADLDCRIIHQDSGLNDSKLLLQMHIKGRAVQTELINVWTEPSSSSMVSYSLSDDPSDDDRSHVMAETEENVREFFVTSE